MTGPFPTARDACASVPACVSMHFMSPEDPPPTNPQRDCGWTESLADPGESKLHDQQRGFSVHLAEFECAVPSFLPRGVSAGHTRALVERADGWWLGPAWFDHDDTRDCWDELRPASWMRHGPLDVLSGSLTRVCKYVGSERDQALEVVFDPIAKPPRAFDPIELGARTHCVDGVEECPPAEAVAVPSHWDGELFTAGTQTHRFR